jgi:hypothetical protein
MDASSRSSQMDTTAPRGGVTPSRPDDADVLVGLRAFAEFATSEGFKISHSSLQKYCSPGVNTGPEVIGYWGVLPTSTKGLVRAWIRSRHRTERPVSRRWDRQANPTRPGESDASVEVAS